MTSDYERINKRSKKCKLTIYRNTSDHKRSKYQLYRYSDYNIRFPMPDIYVDFKTQ